MFVLKSKHKELEQKYKDLEEMYHELSDLVWEHASFKDRQGSSNYSTCNRKDISEVWDKYADICYRVKLNRSST